MIVDKDDFLSHYGVPGMKWGVRRKQRKAALQTSKTNVALAKQQLKLARQERNQFRKQTAKRVTTTVGVVGAAVVGAMIVGKLLDNHGAKSIKQKTKEWAYEFSAKDKAGRDFVVQSMNKGAFDIGVAEFLRRTSE